MGNMRRGSRLQARRTGARPTALMMSVPVTRVAVFCNAVLTAATVIPASAGINAVT